MKNLTKLILIPVLLFGLASTTLSDETKAPPWKGKPWENVVNKFREDFPNSYFAGQDGNQENEMSYFNESGDERGNILSFPNSKRLCYGYQDKRSDSLIMWTKKENTQIFYVSKNPKFYVFDGDTIRDTTRIDDSTEVVINDSLRSFYSR